MSGRAGNIHRVFENFKDTLVFHTAMWQYLILLTIIRQYEGKNYLLRFPVLHVKVIIKKLTNVFDLLDKLLHCASLPETSLLIPSSVQRTIFLFLKFDDLLLTPLMMI
jgi:hypothetical protein